MSDQIDDETLKAYTEMFDGIVEQIDIDQILDYIDRFSN
jgi:hypothetical protein